MILIKNGTVVLEDNLVNCDILIKDDKIASIDKDIQQSDAHIVDATGLTIMAGFVDMHCHLRDPGFEYKGDIQTETRAAVAGGFVSVCCMPNTNPFVDNVATVQYIVDKAKRLGSCRVYPIGCITKGQNGIDLTDFAALKLGGVVALSDDGKGIQDGNVMRLALELARQSDMLLISHCEDCSIANGGYVNEGTNSKKAGLKGQSRVAEELQIARDILLADYLDARVHIAHVSTRQGVDMIRAAKKRGVKVTAETCPQYFAATDALILRGSTKAKMNPPLRTEDDVNAIVAGLVDGTIDCIATDHAPHSFQDKDKPMDKAAFGTIGFETAFCISYTHLTKKRHISLQKLSSLMSKTPANILGLGSGTIAVGNKADIAIVDTNCQYKIDCNHMISKSKNSVFDGVQVAGKVVCTIISGVVKY